MKPKHPLMYFQSVLFMFLCLFTILSGCMTASVEVRRGPTSSPGLETGEMDNMEIKVIEEGLKLLLDGEICADIDFPVIKSLGAPEVTIEMIPGGWRKVNLLWNVPDKIQQDELAVRFKLKFDPDFWWAPHLTPTDGYIVSQHVFRSPAVIVQQEKKTLVIAADIDLVGQLPGNPWFMDYNAIEDKIWIGMSQYDIPKHVFFEKKPGMVFEPGQVELGFYISAYNDDSEVRNPWSKVCAFFWEKWARPLYRINEPVSVPLDKYVGHTYNWAFNTWKDFVWQEFDINGQRVGAPQFIVNASQSPNYPGEWYQRECLSIWNQAWFSSLRSASGVYRYADRTGNSDLLEKAQLTKELALAAPMKDGIFPSVIRVPNKVVKIDGKDYRRTESWDKAYWTNSNRRPYNYDISSDWYHILDASWTCLQMLVWYEELEQDQRLIDYCRTYADRLLKLQDKDGFFPGWLHPETFEPGTVMNQTPETSMSVTFLIRLADITGDNKYRRAALKAMDAVLEEIVPGGRWEDYETYWSCCGWGSRDYLGKKVERNGLYKQNSLSVYWTAEALLECYHKTGKKIYLDWGRRTIDELSMYQQVWQPPFIYVPALGGFGVMNADGEWNDSRETLFAELYLRYYRETGDPHLFERGVTALKSGFIMMYCPENPRAKRQWEKRYSWFGPEDYGFTIENYGHGGRTSPEGGGVGSFTIYDWGNGAASEARNRIHDHFGDVYIDLERNRGFGIDSILVQRAEDGWLLKDYCGVPREVKVVFSNGKEEKIQLDGKYILND